jgi:hypothetical protein
MTRRPQTPKYVFTTQAVHATHTVGVWSVAMQVSPRGNLCIFGAAADEVFLT